MSILPEQQSSASNTRYTKKKSAAKTKEKEPVRPHVKASLEDINWLRSQPPCVQQLWLDCVAVEQFGCQLRKLETHLSSKSFRIAKTALEKRELFRFEAITTVSPSGRSNITGWKIENFHGYYYKAYWEMVPPEREVLPASGELLPASGELLPATREEIPDSGEVLPPEREILPDVAPETLAVTEPAKNQPLPNHTLTTPLPPTKVVEEGSCISQETQQTPLGGAAATSGEMQEEEDVPASHSPLVAEGCEVASEELTNLGGDKNCAAGSDIAKKQNSYVVEAKDCDGLHGTRRSHRSSLGENEMSANGAQIVLEVGHADIVERICEQAAIHYYHPTEEQREQMMELTVRQLDVVSQRFQQQMSQRLTYPNRAKTKLSFEFALGLAKRSAPV